MKEEHRELEEAVELAIFKTNDPKEIRKRFTASFEAWQNQRSTLGGYLRDIRQLRDLTADECAKMVGVQSNQWRLWEANLAIPTQADVDRICQGMKFGKRKRRDLLDLKAQAPRHRLTAISLFRPELLAARGVAMIDAELEWKKLPLEVKSPLSAWGRAKGFTSYGEVMDYLASLPDEEARLAWVDDVLASYD